MRKYWVFILVLFVTLACQKKEIREEEVAEEHDLSLRGNVINMNDLWSSAFKLQLIQGEIDVTDFDENYCHPEAQVFVTELWHRDFEFNGLQEGKYTLFASKRGYQSFVKTVELRRDFMFPISVEMRAGDDGLTGKIQIWDEEGNDLSEIKVNRHTSAYFYLYNGKGISEPYTIMHMSNDNYLRKYVLIDGEIVLLSSNWVKEIKPGDGILEPHEVVLIEVVIDPLVYLLKEHSSCQIYINRV